MQQTYVAAYSNLKQFAGDAKFSTWLTRIAINEALGRQRREARFTPIEGVRELRSEPMRDPSPEENASRRELAGILEHAIDALPESYRSVIMLREVEGMTTAEAAEVLGVSDDALKMRLHRAKELLRDSVSQRVQSHAADAFPFYAPRCDRVVAEVLARIRALERAE
jgi:RNA polymerase sigma-70 factor (ECF subfamily)